MTEQQPTHTQTYRISGMDCADCARGIARGVGKLDGVEAASISFASGVLLVTGQASEDAVVGRVRELGYDVGEESATPAGPSAQPEREKEGVAGFVAFLRQRRDTTLALVAGVVILPALITEFAPGLQGTHWLFDVSALLALLLAGYPIARSAWRSLAINHEISINVLMTIAAAGAVVIGAYTEAGLVMVLFALGEALEGYTVEQARDSIRSLMTLTPNEAIVLRPCLDCREHLGREGYEGGPCPFCGLEEKRVPVEELEVGEVIIVKPGERIAMDGVIISGASFVNQAPITGESRLIEKKVGDEVFAGAINGEGALQVEVTQLVEDNTISRLIRMVEEAQSQQAPSQRFIDRFASIYTPAVVVFAALVAIIPPLVFAQPFWDPGPDVHGWLYRALALLVVACPCALVISTPVSFVSAISNAARNGVLVKGGVYLERLAAVRAFAFDKTGTLTRGEPTLVLARSIDCVDESAAWCQPCTDFLALASAVERRSEHPLAAAVMQAAVEQGVQAQYPAPTVVRAAPGQGVYGQVEGHEVFIGSHAYFDAEISHERAHCELAALAAQQGQTTMMLSVDSRYQGYLIAADTARAEAPAALAALKAQGVESLTMLTGDDPATARAIADQLGITDVRAGLLPEDKVMAVRALMDEYQAVAMVGDGVNDAPALATSSVGIAMGAAGTAQAMETADIALMSDDLLRLPFALRLSRATMRTIYANVAFSLGIKALFLALVLAGAGTMWMAVLADVGASLLVTLNGMRLLRRPNPVSLNEGR